MKSVLVIGIMTLVFGMGSQVSAQEVQVPTLSKFTTEDSRLLFGRSDTFPQIAELSLREMNDTEGSWLNFAVGGAAGLGFYAANNWYRGEEMTLAGALYSMGTGAMTGGVGGSLIRASGGGLVGNLAWRPNMVATNFGFSQYGNYRGW